MPDPLCLSGDFAKKMTASPASLREGRCAAWSGFINGHALILQKERPQADFSALG